MSLIAPVSAITNRFGAAVHSAGQSALIYVLVAVMGIIGAGFLVAALYIWLASVTDVLAAALILGTGFLAVAGIALATVIARSNRRKRQRRRSAADSAMMASTLSLASTGLRIASRARGGLLWPALAAIAAGWYLSQSGGGDDEGD